MWLFTIFLVPIKWEEKPKKLCFVYALHSSLTQYRFVHIKGSFGLRGGMEESKVELTENKLILGQRYSIPPLSPSIQTNHKLGKKIIQQRWGYLQNHHPTLRWHHYWLKSATCFLDSLKISWTILLCSCDSSTYWKFRGPESKRRNWEW